MAGPEGPNGEDSVGGAMAAEMLKNLVLLNENIQKSHEIYRELLDSIRDLSDYHESYMRAMEILIEQSEEGKLKFTLGDLAKAMAEAAAEVMPDDEGGDEEEDEHGGEDPRVRVSR